MAKTAAHEPGSFCWIELATTDQQAAKQFYASLFGWTSNDFPMGPSGTYTMFQLEGQDCGAAFTITPEDSMPPNWTPYVSVSNADQAARKALELGGTLLKPPFDVFTAGRMAVIQDPTGAVFCIWQAKENAGIGIWGEEGALCWADLNTVDPRKAQAFYQGLFGWKLVPGEHDSSGYLHIQNGEQMIGGIPPHRPKHGSHWLLYIQTADCDGVTAKAEQHGATVIAPPMAIPGTGRFSVLADPQGAVFALFEPPNAA